MTTTARFFRALGVLLVAVTASSAPPADALEVWTALATEKIYPSTPARAERAAAIAAARNEFESFQIVVQGPVAGVSASATPLVGPATIGDVKLYREAYIDVTTPSAYDGRTGRIPDGLVPDVDEVAGEKRNAFPFDVPPGESRVIWVDVFVPASAPPGEYRGEITVQSSGGIAVVPVSLTVWNFTLPSTASLKSAFLFWGGSMPARHGSEFALGTDNAAKLRVRYGQLALEHRVTLSRIDDGNTSLAHLEQYYAPLVDGTAPTRLRGAKLTAIQYLGGDAGHRSWVDLFKRRGWFDRLFDYTCDEPPLTCNWSDIPARAAKVHAADPGFRTLVTTTIGEADANAVTSAIDVIVPSINGMHDRPGTRDAGDQRSTYDAFDARPNKEVWLYQSCMSHGCGGTVNMGTPTEGDLASTGWASYMIDASAVRNRAMQWLAFRHRAIGELYWETAFAYVNRDPWVGQYDFSGNGDGTLFYPGTPSKIGGTTHVPVASIRLKMIREGMEDFEYLTRLAEAGDRPLADEIATELFPTTYSTERSPQQLMAARERIARRILELQPGASDLLVSTGSGGGASAEEGAGAGSVAGASADASFDAGAPVQLAGMSQGGCASGTGAAGLVALLWLSALLRRRRRR